MTFFQLIGNPSYQHKYVLERIIGLLTWRTREELIIHYDDEINSDLFSKIDILYKKYSEEQYPLEYILWYVEYGGLRFSVSENTIIPRPETEYMIEAVREYFDAQKENDKSILVDIGTGSGVLGLSLLYSHASHIAKAFLIDISDKALEVAQSNYDHLVQEQKIDKNISVTLSEWNLFDIDVITNGLLRASQWPIVVTANLPYIPDESFDTNPDPSIKYEPRVAFVGGDDGLDLYRIMFAQIRESGYKVTQFLEMMTRQVDILAQEFDRLAFEEIKTFHANIRIVKAVVKS